MAWVLLISLLLTTPVWGGTLNWHASESLNVLGYIVQYGPASRTYDVRIDVGKVVSWPLPALVVGQTYFIAVSAYNKCCESVPSEELRWVEGESLTPPPVEPTTPLVDTVKPLVEIVDPSHGASVRRGRDTTIVTQTYDAGGTARVWIFVNGVQLCTDPTTPYSCRWRVPNTRGVSYTLQARAIDQAGNVSALSPVVTVRSR